LIGGKRGSGKSICSSNIAVSQYESGNTSVIFTIEMTAYEVLERNLSILADVNHQSLKQNKLSREELLEVVKARAGMFEDSGDLVEEFKRSFDKFKFEQNLVRNKKLKQENQMIIIDDRALTVTSLDLHLGRLKSRFGDKLTVCVVDYLNQIVIEGTNQYDWQPQVEVSKKLKNLARKYDLVMVSPYQIDATGEARFAKGILDAADIALVMEAHDKEQRALTFSTTKIRGGREMTFTSPIDWDTLRISPNSIEAPTAKKETKQKSNKTKENLKQDDSNSDIPWNI
jgi:replicative DNA helicase